MALGDGQVMDRVRSYLMEPTFANVEGMTPDDVARRRAMSEALLGRGMSSNPVTSIPEGLNRMLQSFLGGRGLRQAEGSDAFLRDRAEQQQVAGLGEMANFAYPDQTTLQPATTRPVDAPTYNAGTQDEWSAGDFPGGEFVSAPGTGIDSGVRILDEFEGFRATPYEDWSYRPGTGERYLSGMRIGYGQTIPGMENITPEQAQGMLRQQIEQEYVPSIVGAIGAERWASLTPDQQGVLISLTHNYGSLPGRIIPALQSGDPAAAAQAIAALGGDNSGINQRRREAEAAYFAGTGAPREVTTPNPTGEFVRGLIENPQTRPMAQALIEQEIARLTAPPTPGEAFTLAEGAERYDAQGNLIAANQPEPEPGFRLATPQEREAAGYGPDDPPLQIGPDNRFYELGGGGTNVEVNIPGQPMIGTIPPGYQATEAETGGFTMAPVPGGPAAQEAEQARVAAEINAAWSQRQTDTLTTTLANAEDIVQRNPGGTTGWGAYLAALPASEARTLQSLLDTAKALIGFESLQAMRDASPTGGALGAITERELAFLQSVQGNLDTGLSADILLRNIQQITQSMQRFNQAVAAARGGGGAAAQPAAQPAAEAGAVQEGATATNPQTGERIIFRNGQWGPL